MAKSSKRFGIKFDGFAEMMEKYEKLGGSVKDMAESCLDFIPGMINPKLKQDMAKHRRSGQTERSIVGDPSVEWSGSTASIDVGFHISNGGLASIFLMYGTPRHAPANQYGTGSGSNPGMAADKKLFDDIYGAGTQRTIREKQKQICDDKINKLMGG